MPDTVVNDLVDHGSNLVFFTTDETGRVVLAAEALREYLLEDTAALTARKEELLASVARAPETVEDRETLGRMGDLVKLIATAHKNAEADRVARKAPFLAAERLIDSVYKRDLTDPLAQGKVTVERRMTQFQRALAEQERRRREEEARRQREEAERLRLEAEEREAAAQDEQQLDEAITTHELARQAEADSRKADKAAEAPPAELSRERGEYGSIASLRREWTFRQPISRTDLDLELLREHLPLQALEQAIRSYIRAGGRELRGVEIFESTSTVVR